MRARGPQIIGAAVLFVSSVAGCGGTDEPAVDSPVGSACLAEDEGSERCYSDLNIYRCTDGVLVFVRSATVTTACPVIGYVGITRAQQPRGAGRRLRARALIAQV